MPRGSPSLTSCVAPLASGAPRVRAAPRPAQEPGTTGNPTVYTVLTCYCSPAARPGNPCSCMTVDPAPGTHWVLPSSLGASMEEVALSPKAQYHLGGAPGNPSGTAAALGGH